MGQQGTGKGGDRCGDYCERLLNVENNNKVEEVERLEGTSENVQEEETENH